MRFRVSTAILLVLAGCDTSFAVPTSAVALPEALPADVFETLKNPADAHAELCDRSDRHHVP